MPPYERGPLPERLSQTGAFADTGALTPSPGLVAYEVNVPFWSDGADKRRWIAVPRGERVRFSPTGEWSFPDGTVFVKHFESGGRRVETRVLVRDAAGGVYGASYKWRPDQADAELVREGRRDEGWYLPGPADCRKCHLAAAGGVLGVNTRQLNRGRPDATENQLLAWSRLGLFDAAVRAEDVPRLPRLTPIDQPGTAAGERARSYLDANCAHCHRPGGAAADFDARSETPPERQALIDAPARINLGIDRARQVAPNDPWRSMVLRRMETLEETRMPPIGHESIDRQGAAILREWIASLPGPPVIGPPAIEPTGGDFREPVRVTISHPDPAVVVCYTLDGGPPGPSSPVYGGPLRVTTSATVRARAFKPGHTQSIVVQDTFVIGD
jgi:uncharacterized repeat protein (TIGR03806 family)